MIKYKFCGSNFEYRLWLYDLKGKYAVGHEGLLRKGLITVIDYDINITTYMNVPSGIRWVYAVEIQFSDDVPSLCYTALDSRSSYTVPSSAEKTIIVKEPLQWELDDVKIYDGMPSTRLWYNKTWSVMFVIIIY